MPRLLSADKREGGEVLLLMICSWTNANEFTHCITIGLEIGLLTKFTFWSLRKVSFEADLLVKTV